MVRTTRGSLVWLGVVALLLTVEACGGGSPPPEEPQPEPTAGQTTGGEDESAAAREERERREEAERRRAEEEAARRAAERRRVMTVLRERIHFEFDRSDIRSDAESVLQRKVSVLRQYPEVSLRIEGHCDERGSNEYNLALGQRRAEAVRRYLLSYGLDPSRFVTISYGEERPLRDESNEEAWALNRRAEFVVIDAGSLERGD